MCRSYLRLRKLIFYSQILLHYGALPQISLKCSHLKASTKFEMVGILSASRHAFGWVRFPRHQLFTHELFFIIFMFDMSVNCRYHSTMSFSSLGHTHHGPFRMVGLGCHQRPQESKGEMMHTIYTPGKYEANKLVDWLTKCSELMCKVQVISWRDVEMGPIDTLHIPLLLRKIFRRIWFVPNHPT